MPLIERTGAEFYTAYQLERDSVSAEEQAERWVSHSMLEWGDYMGGSSDIQVANARDLPDELGVAEGSDVIRVETGDYGHTRHWVRLSPAPTAEEWNGFEERHEATIESQWEAHVRESLLRLDNYPLFNDETSSNALEEWADGELIDWLGICQIRDRFNCDPFRAEGGEGGVYFDIDEIARVFIPAHVVAWNEHRHEPDFATAADILAEAATVTTERRSGPWAFWREVIAGAIRHSFPKWNDRPAILQSLKDARKYDDDSLRVFADALEEADTGSPWPAILREYAALPAAEPETTHA